MYDPLTGGFYQEDTEFLLNLYSYVGNRPLMMIDPYGKFNWSDDFKNQVSNTVSNTILTQSIADFSKDFDFKVNIDNISKIDTTTIIKSIESQFGFKISLNTAKQILFAITVAIAADAVLSNNRKRSLKKSHLPQVV